MQRSSSPLEQSSPPQCTAVPSPANSSYSQARAPQETSEPAVLFVKQNTDKKEYTIFISDQTHPPLVGRDGDIWFSSADDRSQEAFNLLNRYKRSARMNQFSGSLWYHSGIDWVFVERELDGYGDGVTDHVHPQRKNLLLDSLHFSWRSKSSIMTTKRRRDEQEAGAPKELKRRRVASPSPSVAAVGERGPHASTYPLHIVHGDYFHPDFDFVTEMELAQVLTNPANHWLISLAMQWQTISTFHRENREAGLAIFRALLSHSEQIDGKWDTPGRILAERGHEAKWGKAPRFFNILHAAITSPNSCSVTFCGARQNRTTRLTPEMVMEAWVMGATKFAGLCSILGIPDQKAEEKYLPTLPSHISPTPGECEHWKNPLSESLWHFSAAPGAGLAAPRVDSWVSDAYISHIQGKRLWLMWPGTAKNYQHLYGSVLAGSGPRLDTVGAIECLEGLEVLLVSDERPQLAWTLPAGTIHAALTLSPAATHAGFYCASYTGWKRCQSTFQALQGALGEPAWHGDESGGEYLAETLRFMEMWAKMALERRTKGAADFELEKWVLKTVQEIENHLTWLGIEFTPISQTSSWLKLSNVHTQLGYSS
ncbi:hypothetical protein Agabi119p4_1098 [Agaricus bisporus var. burnettii]|uniref:Uncharacterized protein n=1 Tax=Agaricus bisporus var. burnettii TaxID=192524 RepID=A0A8H7FBR4_AGABI|nr:hypothetical protein Agabi119p4_1412 [Agaricus bisporus var. burnettii]KAF7784933.1 hypothetical protein Agabi119p4_1098 [Agaricus bisporus var. burnettii]